MKIFEEKSVRYAIVASALSITASLLYNWSILSGKASPSISSWAVWLFITLLHFLNYQKVTGGWVKSLLPLVDSVLCIITTLLVFKFGSFKDLSVYEKSCFGCGVVAGVVWFVFKNASFAQVLLQVALVIGFIPTFIGILNHTTTETWLPWFLWTGTFSAQYMTVKSTPDAKKIEFLYPVNMTVFHAAVFVLAVL